jgi:23S rRNA pseudouridine2604 synthase
MQKINKQENKPEKPLYPMRINKYLAGKGYATRTGADEMIKNNMVTINGRMAVLGDKILETDTVNVKSGRKPKKYEYFAYNKPVGIITHSAENGEQDIKQNLLKSGMPPDVFPVGRLDKDSSGLIILTNDGRITDRLLNPKHEHHKKYIVKTLNKLQSNFKKIMEVGVDLEDFKTAPCSVTIKRDNEFSITLSEGKKHQIRRMVVALKNEVVNLKRTDIMNISLGKLETGKTRKIEGEELSVFLKELGL